jgi:hypothetical protein
MEMVGTFVNRGALAAGVVTLALLAGAIGLAGPTAQDCLSAAAAQPEGQVEPVRARVRPAYAMRAGGAALDGAAHPRARSRPVSATSGRPLAAADAQLPRKIRPGPGSATTALPAGAPYACA